MVIAPNASSMDNFCHCFRAKGVEKTAELHLDRTEDIDVVLLPRDEVKRRLERGEFIQSLIVAPLWKYFSMIP